MRIVFILAFVVACFAGCKKKEKATMEINGKVTDNANGAGISGASVKIYYKPYQNGVYVSSYSLLTTASTDASGNYSFNVEKPNTDGLKFVVEASAYFPGEKIVNPDNISTSSANTQNFSIDASGTLAIHIKNTTPIASDDFIQFQTTGLNYSCSICCGSSPIQKFGMTVDTSFSCMRYANRYIYYNYIKTKAAVTTVVNDSVYLPAGTTVNLDIFY